MNVQIVVKSIIFNKNRSRILLLQRSSDDPIGANTWEGSGGNIEYGKHHIWSLHISVNR